MASDGYIHGGTDEREVARLEKQARWVAPWLLERFEAKPGMRVLDLATGVGAMAGELLRLWPGIELFGVDLSAAQLSTATRNHPQVHYARGNGAALPFADASFDRVHCSWLLEHVAPAVAVNVLREVRRVLEPGGWCHFTEVDNSTFSTSPPLPVVQRVLDTMNEAQQRGGGDPFIGPKLQGYFEQAGFTRIDARPRPTLGSKADPTFFQGFIDEFAEIFESLDEALGPTMGEQLQHAAATLRGLIATPGSELRYAATIVIATR